MGLSAPAFWWETTPCEVGSYVRGYAEFVLGVKHEEEKPAAKVQAVTAEEIEAKRAHWEQHLREIDERLGREKA